MLDAGGLHALLRELNSPASERRMPGAKWLQHADVEAHEPPTGLLLSLFAEILNAIYHRILRACSRWMGVLLSGDEAVHAGSGAPAHRRLYRARSRHMCTAPILPFIQGAMEWPYLCQGARSSFL